MQIHKAGNATQQRRRRHNQGRGSNTASQKWKKKTHTFYAKFPIQISILSAVFFSACFPITLLFPIRSQENTLGIALHCGSSKEKKFSVQIHPRFHQNGVSYIWAINIFGYCVSSYFIWHFVFCILYDICTPFYIVIIIFYAVNVPSSHCLVHADSIQMEANNNNFLHWHQISMRIFITMIQYSQLKWR